MTNRVRNIIRALLFTGTFTSLFFVPWPIVRLWLSPLPDDVGTQVENALDYDFDGMMVYVGKAGQPSQWYSAGWHDRQNNLPARGDALFKIGSIGKLYIAAAITKLIAQGTLHAEDSLAMHFPELAHRVAYADRISVSMMLQHTSGLYNYTETPGYWLKSGRSDDEIIALLLDKPASFAPGTSYEYSNSNFLLLWELIHSVSGKPAEQYIEENILRPLALIHTYFSIHEIDKEKLMGGYYEGVLENIKENDYGSMVATTEDVGRFVRALNNGELFTPDEQAHYVYYYEHGGLIPGYMSHVRYYSHTDTVVVMVINTTDFDGYDWNLSQILFNRIGEILDRQTK